MRRELQIFFTALMFYTRIPCPSWVNHDAGYLNLATRYFPFIGWIVALVSWLTYLLSSTVLSTDISVVLSMTAGILTTGAFHEDGFADVCDGFGGGWTKEKILVIMKDSRVGTYGAVGLILILMTKFMTLQHFAALSIYTMGAILLMAHSLSRLAAVCIIFTLGYAREDADSKAKPVAQQLQVKNLITAGVFGLFPLAWLCTISIYFLVVVTPVLIIILYLRGYFKKWLGGYTGDCLGATQQVTEVAIYLTVMAIWKFI